MSHPPELPYAIRLLSFRLSFDDLVHFCRQAERVPLIIRVPDGTGSGSTTPGTASEGLVESIDLFPTLAELCEVTPPVDLQGQSLVPMLKNPQSAGKEVAYTVVTRGKHLGKAIRTQRYHYTQWHTGEEFYDLSMDPHETTNLVVSPKHKSLLSKMRTHLPHAEAKALAQKR